MTIGDAIFLTAGFVIILLVVGEPDILDAIRVMLENHK